MEYRALGDLCTITSSKRIFADQYVENGIPFYRSREIIEKNNNSDISEPLFISPEVYATIKAKFGVPQKGDMLLTSVGTIGIPYIVKDECFYFKDGNLTWMKDFSKELSSRYLYYWISSDFGKDSLVSRCIGSSQSALTIDILKKYKILVPDIATQERIVCTLSAYDNLIEVNNRRIKVLEQMAENLYKEWFVRFRFPGHETAEFEDGIPKEWITKPLGEWMCENFNGGWGEEVPTPQTPQVATVIRGTDIGDIKKSRFCDVPLRYHKANDIKTKKLKENDIILELSNGNINNIGRTLYITNEILAHFDTVICASFCKTLRFQDRFVAFFIWQYIEYLQNSGLMFFYKNTGANGINNFNFKRFLRMPISIPKDFESLKSLIAIFEDISIIREKNYNLIKQRDLLLPRLMSGKLMV